MIIAQKPNAPIIIALSGLLVSVLTTGILHSIGETVYTIAITIWAYEEIARGANLFRHLLGTAVLLTLAYHLIITLK